MATFEFDSAYSALTGEYVGEYVPTISTADGQTLQADFGSLAPEWHALTGITRQYGYRGPIMHPSETLADDTIRAHVIEVGGDTFAIVAVVAEDEDGDGGDFGSELAGWAVIYREAAE